jgi:hypothetical protein
MRIVKWISPVIVALGLAMNAQAVLAGLFDAQPGACKPVKACEPVKHVEPLPLACQPVQVYVPPVKPCEPVQAVPACGPVKPNGVDRLPFVFEHLGYKVDRALHVAAYKLHAWKHEGYAKEYSPAPCDPVAPVSAPPASAPAPLPAAPAPAAANHS